MDIDLSTAVDWKRGLVSPEIYFDEATYQEELNKVFSAIWMPIGLESLVPDPGSYVTTFIGEVPVIVSRDRAGAIHVLVNRCSHRGNKVCLFDRGKCHSFTCSYHGWTYGLDGKLVGVPREKELYGDGFDRNKWGLEEAKVANFHGLLFASLNKSVAPLEESLTDDTQWWLRNYVLLEPVGGIAAVPGWHRYSTPSNWKLMAENFVGDNYHVTETHASWIRVISDYRKEGRTESWVTSPMPLPVFPKTRELTTGFNTGRPMGLGSIILDDSMYQHDLADAKRFGNEVVEWVKWRKAQLDRALIGHAPKPYSFINGCLFPTLCLMGFNSPLVGRHFITLHPRGVEAHEAWQFTALEREMPDVVKDVALERVYQVQYMAGTFAPDDVENFGRMKEALHAKYNQRRQFNYRINLGHSEDKCPGLPGNLGQDPSEVNQRQFYRYWAELMAKPATSTQYAVEA